MKNGIVETPDVIRTFVNIINRANAERDYKTIVFRALRIAECAGSGILTGKERDMISDLCARLERRMKE